MIATQSEKEREMRITLPTDLGGWNMVAVAMALLITGAPPAAAAGPLRSEVEAGLPSIEAAYVASPGDHANRRAFAEILYKLGDVWRANDVMAPLATASSSNVDDLKLGAELAYLVGEYDRAEELYERLRSVADETSDEFEDALRGLVLTAYQTDRYEKVKDLPLPEDEEARGEATLLTFMKRFEGHPNQIEWSTPEKVAHLPMINDYTQPGVLPLFSLQVNGHPVEFILDTGGDRMYIDEGVAEKVGIRNIAKRQARYAYTQGKTVDEPLGVADAVTMGEVTMKNVPVIVAKWKVMGPTSDGVITTQMLKKFLSTVDYDKGEIVFRERNARGRTQFLEALDGDPVRMPFWMPGTHLMFAKGSLDGRRGLNMLLDSGLAMSMPMVILDETVEVLGLTDEKVDIEGTKLYWVPLESHGVGGLIRGATQAVGNIFVEEDAYWQFGFMMDALISHQYLRHFGSWTIDFDTFTYYFPPDSPERAAASLSGGRQEAVGEAFEVEDPEEYVGGYEVAPGVALEITAADGTVFLQAPGQQKIGMEAVARDEFLIRLANAEVSFERDASGTVVALVLDQGGNQTRGTRK